MSESEPITQSMGDFVTLLVREISQSLALARYEAPLVQVEKVRVRFGEEQGAESAVTERYPFMADGWEVEMNLGTTLQAQLYGKPIDPGKTERPLLDIFGSGPISHIKGVSRDWADFFQGYGIKTVEDLASLSPEGLQALARKRDSIRLWELQAKARLLSCEIPFFPPSVLEGTDLYTLVKMGPEAVEKQAGPSASKEEILRLSDTLQLLTVVLDASVLQSMSLEEFLNG